MAEQDEKAALGFAAASLLLTAEALADSVRRGSLSAEEARNIIIRAFSHDPSNLLGADQVTKDIFLAGFALAMGLVDRAAEETPIRPN